jgi:hypothetical protein
VPVAEEYHQGALPGEHAEQRVEGIADRLLEAVTARVLGKRMRLGSQRQQRKQQRHVLLETGRGASDPRDHLLDIRAAGFLEAKGFAQHLPERLVRWHRAVGGAMAVQHAHVVGERSLELVEQAGLAHAGLSRDGDEARPPVPGFIEAAA